MTPKDKEKLYLVKKKIIISMCAIILLVLTLFGITFAYFTSKVEGNKNETSISVTAAELKLEYNGENSYIEVNALFPGQKIESKVFSVENTGTREINNYDVILENLVNDLSKYEDLTYELKCESSDEYDCNGSTGIFPNKNQVIATNTINAKTKHTYILKLTYNETNTNQSVDMNKEISAKVNIKHDILNIKTFKIYGNSKTIEENKTYEYLGNYDEVTNKYIIPINIDGNIVNISLNEPLRKLGDMKDYIDLENKIVVRRVKQKVFDGTEEIFKYENGVYYALFHKLSIPAISNYYSNDINDTIHFTSTKNSNAIHFRVDESIEDFKTLLTNRYNNNEPLKVTYALFKDEFEVIEVPEFKIDNEKTIIVCDNNEICASNIEVEFNE